MCIATDGKINTMYSAEDLTACCSHCGNGCNGGFPLAAMDYIASHGLVTGGLYGDTTTCKLYTLKPFEHHVTGESPVVTVHHALMVQLQHVKKNVLRNTIPRPMLRTRNSVIEDTKYQQNRPQFSKKL